MYSLIWSKQFDRHKNVLENIIFYSRHLIIWKNLHILAEIIPHMPQLLLYN